MALTEDRSLLSPSMARIFAAASPASVGSQNATAF